MTQYLYRIQPTRIGMLREGPTAAEGEAIAAHFSYLQALADAGRLFMAGRTLQADERAFGIAIFDAASDEEARSVLTGDPAVRRGVMRGEVYPFRTAIWSGNPLATVGGPSRP